MIIQNGQIIAIDAVSAGYGLVGNGRPNNPLRLDAKITGLVKVDHDNTLSGDGLEDSKLGINLENVKDDRIYGFTKDGSLQPVSADYVTSAAFNAYSAAIENNKLNKSEFESVSGDFALKSEIPTKVSQLENDEGYLKEHQSLTAYATKSELESATSGKLNRNEFSDVSGDFALKSEIPTLTSGATQEWVKAQGYATSSYVDNSVSTKLDTSVYETTSGNFALKSDIPSIEGLATTEYVNQNVSGKLDTTAFSTVSGTFLTAHQSLDDYAKKSDIPTLTSGATQEWVKSQGYATSSYVDDALTAKLDTTAFSTVSGTFLTAHQSLEDYATTGFVNDSLTAKLDTTAFSTVSSTFLTAHQSLEGYLTTGDLVEYATTAYVNSAVSGKLDSDVFKSFSSALDTTINALTAEDVSLQSQIDAINAGSDVKDIVADHAGLEAYPTSTLGDNDIIKVLKDETSSNATTYYRWSSAAGEFNGIGSVGPYRTVSEQTEIDNVFSASITALNANKLDVTAYEATTANYVTTADITAYALSADVDTRLSEKLDNSVFESYTADALTAIQEGQAASAWINQYSADFATTSYVDGISAELSATTEALIDTKQDKFDVSGVSGVYAELKEGVLVAGITGISGISGVSVNYNKETDTWIFSADKGADTYFAGKYESINSVASNTTFKYNTTSKSGNIVALDDGSIIVKNVDNENSTPSKLTFNINEAITSGPINFPGWLLNSIALYQGRITGDAVIETEGVKSLDVDNYKTTWDIEWNETPVWQCGDYYAAECGLSELTFGYTVENGTNTCCYKVVYTGDATGQGDENTASIISKLTVVASTEALGSEGSTPEVTELTNRVDSIEETLNSKLLNTLNISSVNDISYLQNNQTTVHLTLFKPDMNFKLHNATKVKCFIDRIDYIPDDAGYNCFVLYKLNDDNTATLIAMSNDLTDGFRNVKEQSLKELTFNLKWVDPNEDTLSSNAMYYAGFYFDFGAILMGGNTINWSLSNFKPCLTFIRDNLTAITSETDVRTNYGTIAIDESDGGRVSIYRVFFELKNNEIGN